MRRVLAALVVLTALFGAGSADAKTSVNDASFFTGMQAGTAASAVGDAAVQLVSADDTGATSTSP